MNTNNKKINLDYLSLLLVLSFILFHKIHLVLAGISLSIYSINSNLINSLIKNKIHSKKIEDKTAIDNSTKTIDKKEESLKKDTVISLVEEIEESGYIPSLAKEDTNKAA